MNKETEQLKRNWKAAQHFVDHMHKHDKDRAKAQLEADQAFIAYKTARGNLK